jgi:hypothetical protein
MQTLSPNYQNKQQKRDLFSEIYFYRQSQHNSQELKTTKDFLDAYPRISNTDNWRLVSFI